MSSKRGLNQSLLQQNHQMMPSVNSLAAPLVVELKERAAALGLAVSRLANGVCIINAGIDVSGSPEAGRLIAEICLGGLGKVTLHAGSDYVGSEWTVSVDSSEPVIACLASQYAGWSLSQGTGKSAFNALGSGPARAMGSNEALFAELHYRDTAETACMVMEVDRLPPVELAEKIASRCKIAPDKLTLILTPTTSLCGVIQVVARVLETALHKIHTLRFPLSTIVSGSGQAPVCPLADDFMTGMGRTNDAILFAGEVRLEIDADDGDIEKLAGDLPSSASSDYGKLFREVFKAVDYDFYRIDPMLFSPARVALVSVKSGKVFEAGNIDRRLLEKSFTG